VSKEIDKIKKRLTRVEVLIWYLVVSGTVASVPIYNLIVSFFG
jgi:hypothetical protein